MARFGPLRLVAGVAGFTLLFAAFLFGGAGTFRWTRAWILLAVLFVERLIGHFAIARANPELLPERAKLPLQRGQPLVDRVLLAALMATFAGVVWLSGADVWRWHLLPPPPRLLAALGLLMFIVGSWVTTLALRANAFAVTVVRHQEERGHAIADRGPYTIVRHPMYSGLVILYLGIPLWLGSTAGLVAVIVPMAILATRILNEERFLRRNLAGYDAYAARVRYRLIPRLW